MGSNQYILGLRFLLIIAALAAIAIWGFNLAEGLLGYTLAILTPIIAAIIWGIFTVPDDPSRLGKALVATPGLTRLYLEISFFAAAYGALETTSLAHLNGAFALVIIFHYIISYDRLAWLVQR